MDKEDKMITKKLIDIFITKGKLKQLVLLNKSLGERAFVFLTKSISLSNNYKLFTFEIFLSKISKNDI